MPVRSWTEPKKKQFEYENDPPHHWNAGVPLVRGIFCCVAVLYQHIIDMFYDFELVIYFVIQTFIV